MRTRFHQGLDELKEKLLVMGGLAEQAVDKAVEGYRLRDRKLCMQVLENEAKINQAEREIDEMALDLLAMQQPMAVDLRFITACMKINADLERVGDQAVNIAQRGLDAIGQPEADLQIDIPRMAGTVAGMVRRALESFIEGKADLAEAVLKMDDIVDDMNDAIFITMADKMQKDPIITRQALDALLISRNLERVADHATNIAEDVIFWVRGADIRHGQNRPDQDANGS
ncbi:MAG: phosphate signaling complex protein PhoU [Acidobacteriales bacterium]|nr:phosphate signaling complex protein PhoU [Terriglobales bacterium]